MRAAPSFSSSISTRFQPQQQSSAHSGIKSHGKDFDTILFSPQTVQRPWSHEDHSFGFDLDDSMNVNSNHRNSKKVEPAEVVALEVVSHSQLDFDLDDGEMLCSVKSNAEETINDIRIAQTEVEEDCEQRVQHLTAENRRLILNDERLKESLEKTTRQLNDMKENQYKAVIILKKLQSKERLHRVDVNGSVQLGSAVGTGRSPLPSPSASSTTHRQHRPSPTTHTDNANNRNGVSQQLLFDSGASYSSLGQQQQSRQRKHQQHHQESLMTIEGEEDAGYDENIEDMINNNNDDDGVDYDDNDDAHGNRNNDGGEEDGSNSNEEPLNASHLMSSTATRDQRGRGRGGGGASAATLASAILEEVAHLENERAMTQQHHQSEVSRLNLIIQHKEESIASLLQSMHQIESDHAKRHHELHHALLEAKSCVDSSSDARQREHNTWQELQQRAAQEAAAREKHVTEREQQFQDAIRSHEVQVTELKAAVDKSVDALVAIARHLELPALEDVKLSQSQHQNHSLIVHQSNSNIATQALVFEEWVQGIVVAMEALSKHHREPALEAAHLRAELLSVQRACSERAKADEDFYTLKFKELESTHERVVLESQEQQQQLEQQLEELSSQRQEDIERIEALMAEVASTKASLAEEVLRRARASKTQAQSDAQLKEQLAQAAALAHAQSQALQARQEQLEHALMTADHFKSAFENVQAQLTAMHEAQAAFRPGHSHSVVAPATGDGGHHDKGDSESHEESDDHDDDHDNDDSVEDKPLHRSANARTLLFSSSLSSAGHKTSTAGVGEWKQRLQRATSQIKQLKMRLAVREQENGLLLRRVEDLERVCNANIISGGHPPDSSTEKEEFPRISGLSASLSSTAPKASSEAKSPAAAEEMISAPGVAEEKEEIKQEQLDELLSLLQLKQSYIDETRVALETAVANHAVAQAAFDEAMKQAHRDVEIAQAASQAAQLAQVALETQLSETRSEFMAQSKQLEEVQQLLEAARDTAAQQQIQLAQSATVIATLQREAEEALEREHNLEIALANAEGAATIAQGEARSFESRMKASQEELERMEHEFALLQTDFDQLQLSFKESTASLTAHIATEEHEKSRLKERLDRAQGIVDQLNVDGQNIVIANVCQELESVKQQLVTSLADKDSFADELSITVVQLDEVKNELHVLQEQHRELEEEHASVVRTLQEVRVQLEDAQHEVLSAHIQGDKDKAQLSEKHSVALSELTAKHSQELENAEQRQHELELLIAEQQEKKEEQKQQQRRHTITTSTTTVAVVPQRRQQSLTVDTHSDSEGELHEIESSAFAVSADSEADDVVIGGTGASVHTTAAVAGGSGSDSLSISPVDCDNSIDGHDAAAETDHGTNNNVTKDNNAEIIKQSSSSSNNSSFIDDDFDLLLQLTTTAATTSTPQQQASTVSTAADSLQTKELQTPELLFVDEPEPTPTAAAEDNNDISSSNEALTLTAAREKIAALEKQLAETESELERALTDNKQLQQSVNMLTALLDEERDKVNRLERDLQTVTDVAVKQFRLASPAANKKQGSPKF